MHQRTTLCIVAVLALGCTLVSTTNSSTIVSPVSPGPMTVSTSQKIIATSPIQSSFTVKPSSVLTATQSLGSLSSALILSSSPVKSSSPMKSSSVLYSASAVVSASPTVAPASETVRIPKEGSTYCLQAVLDVSFEVKYEMKDKTVNTTVIDLNGNLQNELKGECNMKTNETSDAMFTITWNEDQREEKHTFTMHFRNYSGNATVWTVSSIEASFDTSDTYAFKNVANVTNITVNSTPRPFGNVSHGKAYFCNAKETIKLGPNVTVTFKNLVLQPFLNHKLYKDGVHCSADSKTDDDDNTVPIAVGAALGGLVLIVLVAYIVGRRRSNRGYEQV